MTALDTAHFHAFGFVVLRKAFEPLALQEEVDHVLGATTTSSSSFRADVGGGEVKGQYAPMMRSPVSLSLLDRFATEAALLLGGPVLPVRAKGVRYVGSSTPWHTDSQHPVASVGFAAYLEPLDAARGALRVLPGSHRPDFAQAMRGYTYASDPTAIDRVPGFAIATDPGDVIIFDEHLLHASAGGTIRRQWRVDYVRDPIDEEEERIVRAYFAGIFPPDWDGGYDVDRHPSYDSEWRASNRPAALRLRELGVYDLADTQEAFARARVR